MTLNLYLFRHGETRFNADGGRLIGGRSNHLPLTERGILQAKSLGERLKLEKINFEEFYMSPALRTKETSKFICQIIGFPYEQVRIRDELQEVSMGDWEGQPRTEIYTKETIGEMNSDSWNFCPPGGESRRQAYERMFKWADSIENGAGTRSIAMVGHGNAIKCFYAGLTGRVNPESWQMEIHNCSITRLKRTNKGNWIPNGLNDYGHILNCGFVAPNPTMKNAN